MTFLFFVCRRVKNNRRDFLDVLPFSKYRGFRYLFCSDWINRIFKFKFTNHVLDELPNGFTDDSRARGAAYRYFYECSHNKFSSSYLVSSRLTRYLGRKLHEWRFTAKDRPCNGRQFQCEPGSCIPDVLVCDGNADCLNEADEANCLSKSSRPHTRTVIIGSGVR